MLFMILYHDGIIEGMIVEGMVSENGNFLQLWLREVIKSI